VVPVFLPPYSPELKPIARLWRDLKDKRADIPVKTIDALSAAMCALIQHYSHATLQSLTSVAYCVQAVAAVQKALYG
jgi:transposase